MRNNGPEETGLLFRQIIQCSTLSKYCLHHMPIHNKMRVTIVLLYARVQGRHSLEGCRLCSPKVLIMALGKVGPLGWQQLLHLLCAVM